MSIVDLIDQTAIEQFHPCLDEVWVYTDTHYRTWKSSMLGAPIDTIEFVWHARLSETQTCHVSIRQIDCKSVSVNIVYHERGRLQTQSTHEFQILFDNTNNNSRLAPLALALIERTCRLVLPEQIPALIHVTRS
jgi:hypothetical protein